ncbi:MAG: patatin-like phospholipase family protein [Dietzia sp.]|uniref:Patatin-like phospholipase family protein n=3 Tax=Dietzia TaxID=37914 RepID=A0ABN2IUB1_9ACTN|nr:MULTISPECIES: patatin-like phospholipase family protein [Dietzia]MBB1041737.1 patatin [Dietzia sp. Cai40]MBB1047049.1 patatin [Dietzia cercidiphylli]MBC7296044.1 patatin-like phospholipase family protein [Dietzia sp.]MCT1514482.1 patatin-like phospholipase family protein [Dietzia cercidiphylli]MDO8396006.1 patatin-like phospholipase family protein [Dietzia sp.]
MKVALALGSGGARGYAHIGAIRELESRGHEVVGVSGASMGAVVGSLLAAGELDRFEEWVRGLAQRDVLRLLDVSFAGGGAIRANKIMGVIGEMLDDVRIEDLAIPYTAVATDLRARREVWFTRGPADIAVRASFAIPSIVTPAIVGGRLMIDGGVTNPVPLEPLASVESDLVLAVSLTGRRAGIRGSTFQESSDPDEPSAVADPKMSKKGGTVTATTARLSGRIRTAAADVRDADLVRLVAARLGQDTSGADAAGPDTAGPDTAGLDAPGIDPTGRGAGGDSRTGDDATPRGSAQPSPEVEEAVEEGEREVRADAQADDRSLESLPGTLRIFDVVSQSIEAMQSILTGYRMAGNRPDVLVEVPSDSCSAFDFHRAEEMIELGRRLTAEALDREGL